MASDGDTDVTAGAPDADGSGAGEVPASDELARRIAPLVEALARARHVVAFTGAGISTESGIPDFRSPGGLWTRYDPRQLTFERYMTDVQVRVASWEMRRELWKADPRPNAAHLALVELERAGRLDGVITQNIDGLHKLAGSRNVVELHGTFRRVMCFGFALRDGEARGCGWRGDIDWAFERIDSGIEDPPCPTCGGIVKAATVSFGQRLYPGVVERAASLATTADLVVAIGSSLEVQPAASLPQLAVRRGVPLVIVNDEPTPLDHLGSVVRGRAGEILPAAIGTTLAAR